MITVLGELAISDLIPLPASLLITAKLDIQSQVTALSVQITLPPITIGTQITMLLDMIQQLNLSLTLGIQPPSISAQLDILAAILALLNVKLIPFVNLAAAFTNGGVFAYAYDGQTASMGGEFTTELATGFPGSTPSAHAYMLVFGTVLPATWAAMQVVFKTTP